MFDNTSFDERSFSTAHWYLTVVVLIKRYGLLLKSYVTKSVTKVSRLD